jgi:hypothetical protein
MNRKEEERVEVVEAIDEREMFLEVGGNFFDQEPFAEVLGRVVKSDTRAGELLRVVEIDRKQQEMMRQYGGKHWKEVAVVTAKMLAAWMTRRLGCVFVKETAMNLGIDDRGRGIYPLTEEVLDVWCKARSIQPKNMFEERVWELMLRENAGLLMALPLSIYLLGAEDTRMVCREIWKELDGAIYWPYYVYDVKHRHEGVYANDGRWICRRSRQDEMKVPRYDWWVNWVLPERMEKIRPCRYMGLEELLPYLQQAVSQFGRGRRVRNYYEALRELEMVR